MRHWSQLATRNWRVKPGRSLAIVAAVALGVGTVVTITSLYASVEATIGEQIIDNWLGRSHLSIESPHGHWGSVDQSLEAELAKIEGVEKVTARYKTRMRLRFGASDEGAGVEGRKDVQEVDVIGIEPEREKAFGRFARLIGRGIEQNDRGVIILEERMARELGIEIGDTVQIEAIYSEGSQPMKVVGLMPAKRVSLFQKPAVYMNLTDVQALRHEQNKVSVIDAIVANPEPEYIDACAERVRALLRERRQGYLVTTATGKLNQLLEAQRATRAILLLFAFVALLTSFFIIITTMSMGMMERIRQLGTMRCVGLTRAQLAALVYAEVVPLGVVGVLLGVPIGFGLTKAGVAFVPHVDRVVSQIVWSTWGIAVAMCGGLLTTILGATAVLWQGAMVSPMRAVNPQARADRVGVIALAAAAGVGLLFVHQMMLKNVDAPDWFNPVIAFCGTASLYGGYMLLAPALVLLVASAAVNVAAPMLGIRRRLAQDQVGRAPWRSAGVCWTLMVGLSLIVYFFVRGESITHAWDFPARLAGTFVWTRNPIPRSQLDEVAKLPGIGDITPINDVVCTVKPRRASILSMLTSSSVFAAGDPDTFLSMAKLDFLQGDYDDARAKLERGGYLLLTPEASHSFGYNLGDKVPVTIADRTVEFEVAAVVRSPAMDIAVSYFQADSYMMLASSCSVLGTLDDLNRLFNIDTISMFLMNVELGETPCPVEFDQPEMPRATLRWVAKSLDGWLPNLPLEQDRMAPLQVKWQAYAASSDARADRTLRLELGRYIRAMDELSHQWAELSPENRWEIFRERLVLESVKETIRRPDAMVGSLRRLKEDIDDDIRKATLVISAIPAISLLVASLGVANLMMVNVNSRAKQLAILRAVGSTKGQIARLVLVEAVVLGLLGSAVGVVLGLHSAHSTNELVMHLIGIEIPWVVPWQRVAGAVAVTWLICLLAGVGPSLRAARSNIISALQTT